MLHLPTLITDLALILGAAAFVTLLFKKLKQPVVLGYIVAGLLVGAKFKFFPTVIEYDSIRTWADIGVIFLLFTLGLEFSFKKLIKVGGVAVITAITGVGFTMLTGYGLGKLIGWNFMDSLFLGGTLAIASTTIIFRAFEELGVKSQKFTGIVIGVLVIEDLVAVVLLVILSTVAVSRTFIGEEMIGSVLKLVFFLILWFVSGIFFLPSILKSLRKLITEETLLVLSLALCFLMVVLATFVGFSPALGAFIMGSILAETTKAEKIEHLMKPLKNLFGAIFFVSVGMLIDPAMLVKHAWPIIASTVVLLIGKPLFVTMGALLSGQPLKIAIRSGMSLSQIGEFSFIIAALGLQLGVTSDFLYPVAVAVSVVTTFTTPYMIRFSEAASKKVESALPQKWANALTKYSIGAQTIREDSDWKKLLRFYLLNIIVFSVLIITIIFVFTEFIDPIFSERRWHKLITASIALIVLLPFLWALAFRRTQRQAYANVWVNPLQRGPLIILLLSRIALAIFYMGFLFNQLFSPGHALIGVLITSAVLLIFYPRIKKFYAKIEMRFLRNLHGREIQITDAQRMLAPWDTHIANFQLNAQSPFVGNTLDETKIREKFGVNIAVIERGNFVINVPSRNERLYPGDIISVIGTDEQLNLFRKSLETVIEKVIDSPATSNVVLQRFAVLPGSALSGISIRESKIRENTGGLIVGIERNNERFLNPESNVSFKSGDVVWIVGETDRIRNWLNKK
ncbi:MAG: cation:proton antiporter [Crocinitomicaceae bacterium]|nr:cation:proton antiporter [Crocinitomicaceae bacterium]